MYKINSNFFSYHLSRQTTPPRGIFCAEMSTLTANGFNPLEMVVIGGYPTSGFIMVSEKTGTKVTFVLVATDYEDEDSGDVIAWIFKPTAKTIKRFPKLALVSVSVFNT